MNAIQVSIQKAFNLGSQTLQMSSFSHLLLILAFTLLLPLLLRRVEGIYSISPVTPYIGLRYSPKLAPL